jgi:hypothetical protein
MEAAAILALTAVLELALYAMHRTRMAELHERAELRASVRASDAWRRELNAEHARTLARIESRRAAQVRAFVAAGRSAPAPDAARPMEFEHVSMADARRVHMSMRGYAERAL